MEVTLLGEILALVMFFAVIGVLMLGFPVAFSLAGTSLIFAAIAHFLGALDLSNLSSVAPRYMGIMLNEVLVAVPLFIFMGMMLERSGIAEKLLITMGRLFGDLLGGLGLAVILEHAGVGEAKTIVLNALIVTPILFVFGETPDISMLIGAAIIVASGIYTVWRERKLQIATDAPLSLEGSRRYETRKFI